MKRIQIIGTQRSGSNLLRVMLHQHQDICAPHPPHLLKTFKPLLGIYNDLSDNSNFRRLIQDMITWVKLNPVPWEVFDPSVEQILEECASHSLVQIFKSIYDWEARAEGKSTWICKSMANYEFIEEFERERLIDKYIYLYRDGRDVALSFKKAVVGPKSAFYCGKQWAKDQEACLEAVQTLGNRVVTICYEELIESPLVVLQKLFADLGLEMPSNVLEFPRSEESIHTAEAGEMWKNVAKPIIPTNKKKYLVEMSGQDRLVYETVAGRMLHQLGYELDYWPMHTERGFAEDQLTAFENEEKLLRKNTLERTPQHDLDLRKGQDDFHRMLIKSLVPG